MAKEKKILFVTTALNSPLHTGCTIRTMNLCQQLNGNASVTMLAVSQFFIEESVEYAKQQFDGFELIKLKSYDEYVPQWGRFLKKWRMHWPYNRGIQVDAADQDLFEKLVIRHDLVWFHTLSAAHPFHLRNIHPSVMDLDDLNMCKYDLRSQQNQSLRLRLSADVQAFKWKRHELDALSRYDRVVVCSQYDKDFLGGGEKICVVPNGFISPKENPVWTPPDPLRLGFIGTLGYGPNYDGLVWFRDQVWSKIRNERPDMKLRIVGSPPQPQYRVEAEGFEYLGYVEDPTEEIGTWSAMIVPIPYGGGTRIKILDAFSKMCPVVSTPVGAHGIEAKHGQHLLLFDDSELFAQACLTLSESQETGHKLARAGWDIFTEKYTWEQIGCTARNIVDELVK